LLLPSTASEGFPKVIAEGAAYGCIPLVSNVSSITQYIEHGQNGIILDPLTPNQLIKEINLLHQNQAKTIALEAHEMAKAFTFSRFTERLKKEVFNFAE
jgi:glycosyltransferase involved in cell wall biosynthesis